MAQWLNQEVPCDISVQGSGDGFDAFGKPVPQFRKTAALEHCRAMGLANTERATNCIDGMCNHIERDAPYEAMGHGMKYLDLIGVYRALAVLLSTPPAREREATSEDYAGA